MPEPVRVPLEAEAPSLLTPCPACGACHKQASGLLAPPPWVPAAELTRAQQRALAAAGIPSATSRVIASECRNCRS